MARQGTTEDAPPVMHYWVITAEQIMSVCQWDLEKKDTFEIAALDNTAVVVGQRQGLPIGGHLSAAYVELLALKREYEVSLWPASVAGMLTARYRDNFLWRCRTPGLLTKGLSLQMSCPSCCRCP